MVQESPLIEQPLYFKSDALQIEGLYAPTAGERGAVISHPHPQMGGSMQNNVVEALVSAFYQNNFSTLRFNFRGVGQSEGIYDDGRGEQEDLIAAMSCLAGKGKKKVVLAGYSFGAWITVKILKRFEDFSDVILVSPPVDFLNFDWSGSEDKIGLIVCGDRDQFCSPESLKTLVEEIHCRLEIVRGADHFYFMKENGMIDVIDAYLKI